VNPLSFSKEIDVVTSIFNKDVYFCIIMNMKMKLTSVLAIAAIGLFSAFKPALKTESFTVDTKNSSIKWVGEKVTGQHSGTINLSSGSLSFNGNNLTGGSFVANMNSIVATDVQGETAQKLEGHLKADDFFGTAKYPTSTFKITKVAPAGASQVNITGNLTIKGITKALTFPATVKRQNNAVVAVAKGVKVDRTKYDIRYNSKSFFESIGDKAIYDDFILDFNLVAKK